MARALLRLPYYLEGNIMKRSQRFIPSALLAALVLVAGCATMQVGSDYDRQASFANYHTFGVMHRDHNNIQNPLVVQRAEDAIVREFTAKGYQLVPDPATADFTVDFTVGSRERTDINSYPAPYVGMGWAGWGGGPGWWGGPYWGNNLDVRQVKEGTLSIDVFDGRMHRPVWHGWAKKELSRKDIAESEEPIRKAVAAILSRFPPT
jgi:predicted small secreted protein